MELSSMLAGESFTDHPVSVCPVIASFMRAYNDAIDHERRQDLYAYASRVVGSPASTQVQRLRAQRVGQWASEIRQGAFARLLAVRRLTRMEKIPTEWIGPIAMRGIRSHSDESHASALALIDELVALGTGERWKSVPSQPDLGGVRTPVKT